MSEAYIDQLKREVARLKSELNTKMFVPATKWGNCNRGCPESYLDKDGFCSPACAMGAPRGRYVTVGTPTRVANTNTERTLADGYWNH